LALIEELNSNPNYVYCKRAVVEKMWPPTASEKAENPQATYSKAKLLELFKDEGVADRKISGNPKYVILKKV